MPHALDPLTPDELRGAIRTLREAGALGGEHVLVSLGLAPPAKASSHWEANSDGGRTAFAVVRERGRSGVVEHRIPLDGGSVASTRVDGVYAAFSEADENLAITAVIEDARVRHALERRGIAGLDLVHVEPWPLGGQIPEDVRGRRVAWAALWVRDDPTDNPYAHPIRGLEIIVDTDSGEVVRAVDHEVLPIPQAEGRWLADEVGPLRPAPAPLEISQPEGPGFRLEGRALAWEAWTLRVGFDPREGLTLHTIAFDGRPICYRASIAELVIPYADTTPTAFRKAAFDTGELGLGHATNSLELGCDCLGAIQYLDVDLATDRGDVVTLPNAICIHEEDHGILWKHTDHVAGRTEVRRSRRLVISSIVTIDNYEYGYFWYLYQDGSIEFEAKLTGIILTGAQRPGEESPYGVSVAPGVNGMYHQHFFCARLDMDIDGEPNSVYEVHSQLHEDTFTQVERLLGSEDEDAGLIDPLCARYWKVVNPRTSNAVGKPTAYKLIPGSNVRPFTRPDSTMGRRMAFCQRHVWVTPFDASERFPAGDYMNLNDSSQGLPEWTKAGEPTEDRDVVLWYVFGTHHTPRPEDWPVMPVERIGFTLKPLGFFDRSPAINLAPPMGHHAGH